VVAATSEAPSRSERLIITLILASSSLLCLLHVLLVLFILSSPSFLSSSLISAFPLQISRQTLEKRDIPRNEASKKSTIDHFVEGLKSIREQYHIDSPLQVLNADETGFDLQSCTPNQGYAVKSGRAVATTLVSGEH